MKIKHLIMVSLLVTGSVGSIATSAAVKAIDEQEVASIDKRDVLRFKGVRVGPRYMKTFCSYSDYRGNTMLIPKDNFKTNVCAKHVVKK